MTTSMMMLLLMTRMLLCQGVKENLSPAMLRTLIVVVVCSMGNFYMRRLLGAHACVLCHLLPRVKFVFQPVGKGYTRRLTNCTICLKEVYKALTCVTSVSHLTKCSVSVGDELTSVLPRSNYKTQKSENIYISFNDTYKSKRNQALNLVV